MPAVFLVRQSAPPRDLPIRLVDVLDAVDKIRRYTTGLSFIESQEDDNSVGAVLYNFAVSGEAARHVPTEVEST